MGRSPCCSKVGLRRGPWSTKEDTLLTNYIQENGEGQWRSLPKKAGLLRCGKSCRLRWMNYLRPGIKRGNISEDEEDLIVRLHGLLGNRWSLIAGRLPGRTDNEIKNYWNTHLLKKLQSAGINPTPHKDLPKPTKIKNPKSSEVSGAAAETGGKKNNKKQKQKKAKAAVVEEQQPPEEKQINVASEPPKMKVYLPKPIRVSSVFSRTNSYDSLASGTSSSDGGAAAEKAVDVGSYVPVAWPSPLFELEDVSCGDGMEAEGLLGVGCILPVIHHQLSESISGDGNMWERVYDEYLQLLN